VEGDDYPLPNTVIVEGMEVNKSGVYDIMNALVRSNGDIRIFVDEQTRVVAARAGPVVTVNGVAMKRER